jgi:hypothetical protein
LLFKISGESGGQTMEERERVNPPPPGNIFTQIYSFNGKKSMQASFFSYFAVLYVLRMFTIFCWEA